MASSEPLDLEEDYRYLFQAGHVWELLREGVNRFGQEWQAYRCFVCRQRGVAVQGILRPPEWKPIVPPPTGCPGPPKTAQECDMIGREDKILRVIYEILATRKGRHLLRRAFVQRATDDSLSPEERLRAREALRSLNDMDADGVRGSA